MTAWIHWLLGIKESPDLIEGGSWSLRCQALPEGAWAVALVAIGVLAAWGVWWLYRLEGRSIGLGTRLLLVGLRLAALACVAGMLVEVVLVITKKELVPSRLLVLVDDSASMSLKDPYADSAADDRSSAKIESTSQGLTLEQLRARTRSELAQHVLGELTDALADQRQLVLYRFAGDLQDLGDDGLKGLRATGTVTALADAINSALAAHRGQPLAGVLVVSDGQSNSGEDPRKIAEAAGRDGVVIQALAVGTEQGPSNARLVDVEASPVVFVRDPTEVSVLYESRGLEGKPGAIQLEMRHDGGWTELGREDVVFAADSVLGRATFKFTPEATGQYEFRASIVDVGPELTDDDNVATKLVKVVRQRVRALLIAGYPAPEVQFLRNALLRDTALEFASWLQSASEGYEQAGHRPLRRLPANLQELSQYDVVILFDPDMRALGSGWSEMLQKFVGSAGGGLIFVAGELGAQQLLASGSEAPGPGGVDNTWLRVLPVVSDPGLYQSSADVQLSSRESWTLELTPEGQADSIFRFAEEPGKNREILTSLPGMYWHCPVTRAKPGASVLAVHGDPRMRNSFGRHVLLATQRYGPGQSVFIGFDSTYRWRYLHEAYFDGFWARLVDRVGRSKALGGRYPFTLSTDKSAYQPGDRVVLRAEWIQSSAESLPPTELKGEVEGPDGQPVAVELEAVPDKEGTLAATIPVDEPGPYLVRITPAATIGEESAMRPATLTFRVQPRSQEFDKPALDRALLDDITRAAGGQVFTLTDYRDLPAAFKIKRVERILEYRDELWDAPVLFGLLVVLLTSEWVLRKRSRMA
jgi:hypothetical protein